MPTGIYVRTIEHRRAISKRSTGKIPSEETRIKISVSLMGENHPFYGKHHSEETKKKISESNKGKVVSEDTRRKLSVALKENQNCLGRVLSDEARKKIGDAHKGMVHTEETRELIRNALTGRKLPELEHHHVKYEEIHGVDEVVLLTRSEHTKIHRRLRREGKCNVPVPELAKISDAAYLRRKNKEGIV